MAIIKENTDQSTMILSVRDGSGNVRQTVSVTASHRPGRGATASVDVLDSEMAEQWFEGLQEAVAEFMYAEFDKAIESGVPMPDMEVVVIEPEEPDGGGG